MIKFFHILGIGSCVLLLSIVSLCADDLYKPVTLSIKIPISASSAPLQASIVTASVPHTPDYDKRDIVARYMQELTAALAEHKYYPLIARKHGFQGTSQVQFHILHNGSAEQIALVKSSGYAVLDNAAMDTIHKASPFPPPPVHQSFPVVVDMEYYLN